MLALGVPNVCTQYSIRCVRARVCVCVCVCGCVLTHCVSHALRDCTLFVSLPCKYSCHISLEVHETQSDYKKKSIQAIATELSMNDDASGELRESWEVVLLLCLLCSFTS